jgi:CRP/FNR family transcriptional regulator, anaerobic regulatory protein
MIASVIDYLNSIHPMPAELVHDLQEFAITKEYGKNELILKEGSISNYTSWIVKGLVRSYYVKDGEEITTKFLWEQATITSVYSYYTRRPGYENIVALEDTILVSLHYDQMQTLYNRHPVFNYIGRVITEKYLYLLEIEVFYLRKQKAEDKYQYILKYFPELLQRVPLKYLATYMGMNFETLSRIRGKK